MLIIEYCRILWWSNPSLKKQVFVQNLFTKSSWAVEIILPQEFFGDVMGVSKKHHFWGGPGGSGVSIEGVGCFKVEVTFWVKRGNAMGKGMPNESWGAVFTVLTCVCFVGVLFYGLHHGINIMKTTIWENSFFLFPIILKQQVGVSENSGTSKSSHFTRVFHYFHHLFWGKHPYFWKHPSPKKSADGCRNLAPVTATSWSWWILG